MYLTFDYTCLIATAVIKIDMCIYSVRKFKKTHKQISLIITMYFNLYRIFKKLF